MTNDKDKCPSCGIWRGAAVDLGASCPKKNCFMRDHMPPVEPSGDDVERVARAICEAHNPGQICGMPACHCVAMRVDARAAIAALPRSATAEKGMVDHEAVIAFLRTVRIPISVSHDGITYPVTYELIGEKTAPIIADALISSGIVRALPTREDCAVWVSKYFHGTPETNDSDYDVADALLAFMAKP